MTRMNLRSYKGQKLSATGIFKREFMSFLDKNKKLMPNHF